MTPLACLMLLRTHQKGAPRHPGQGSTVLDLCCLRESLVGAIGVQADGLLLAIKAADATQPVLQVPDQRPPFQAKRSRAAIGLAYPAFRGLQAVQLAAVQPGGNEVPQPGTGRTLCSTH